MKKSFYHITLLSLFGLVFISCNSVRTLRDGEYLLRKNRIITDNKNIKTDEISYFIKQAPNKRMLGLFRFHLSVYNYAMRGKTQSKLDSFLLRAIAEPPVILDTVITDKSVAQIKLYMKSKGFFNAYVNREIVYLKNKKVDIFYRINSGNPYKIRHFEYNIEDGNISRQIINDSINCLIKTGKNYDTDVFQSERERIETSLKNDGYYRFSKELIKFRADTTVGNNMLDLIMEIKNPTVAVANYRDSVIEIPHKKYIINDVKIYANYNPLMLDTSNYMLMPFVANKGIKKEKEVVYNFLYTSKLRTNPKTIVQAVLFKQGDYYSLRKVEKTYNSLMDLKMFKFVNIQFTETGKDTVNNLCFLGSRIFLTPTPVQSFSVETEATNSSGNLGLAGNLIYQNKNIFKGAETFNFKIKGATEVQKVFGEVKQESAVQTILPFNTIEIGAEVGVDFPKLLFPIRQERTSKNFRPKTISKLGIQYQKLPDFTRYTINGTFGYEFKESVTKKWSLYFADINSVKIFPDSSFQQKINNINDPKIKSSYSNHLTLAGRYTFLLNTQILNKSSNFDYLKIDVELSGNIIRGINSLINSQLSDGSYSIFNLNYAQYAKATLEYRHYFVLSSSNKLVVRGISGYGIAYKNSTVLPFEKSYFAGGSNSVRAWRIYSLGPGAYSKEDVSSFYRTGDIILEGNMEYRFPIYSFFKGALFIDAGNIWLNKKNIKMPDAEFQFNRFYKELAMCTGFGARFDFNFFILRLDAAIAIRDPSKSEVYRWGFGKHINFNLGIGYPF